MTWQEIERPLLAAVLTAFFACGPGAEPDTVAEVAPEPAAVTPDEPGAVAVAERWQTPLTPEDNIDSVAVWHGPDEEAWVVATAKDTDVLKVYDATTGALVRTVGSLGSELGQFERPNGIAVVDRLLLVVERDNARVQILELPGFDPLGSLGEGELRRPYGLAVFPSTDRGTYELYVTDDYETEDERIPPAAELGERVRRYRFSVADGGMKSESLGTFGDTSGEGVLSVVESINADPAADRLLVADEHNNDIKVYTLAGEFTGERIGGGLFTYQAEGIALYPCGIGGYWVGADQGDTRTYFRVFDRLSYALVGVFYGPATANTDGVTLTARPYSGFPAGAFIAVHDDQGASAFAWEDVAAALELPACEAEA